MEVPPPRLWEEPVRGGYIEAADFLRLSGLELLTGYTRRTRVFPPIHFLTGMKFEHAEAGSATFTMPVTDWLLSPQGVVSGSALSFLIDGPLGCAAQTALPVATPYTTSEMSLNFLRPVHSGTGTLTGVGRLLHAGRTILLADARITDGEGSSSRLLGHAASRSPVSRPSPSLSLTRRFSLTRSIRRPTRSSACR